MKIILLLHGSIGTKEELLTLEENLNDDFIVYSINFHGHGGTPAKNDFSIEYFARQVLDWMHQMQIESIHIVGYGLGGYVGLYLASSYPGKVEKMVAMGTKLHWDPYVAEKEISLLNPETILEQIPAVAEALAKMHSPGDWREVLRNTAAMIKHVGQFNPVKLEDFSKINIPVLLMMGDRDNLVSFVETTTVYKELSHGQFAVLPNTKHPIFETNLKLVTSLIKTFIVE